MGSPLGEVVRVGTSTGTGSRLVAAGRGLREGMSAQWGQFPLGDVQCLELHSTVHVLIPLDRILEHDEFHLVTKTNIFV